MATIGDLTVRIPLSNNETDEFEEPVNPHTEVIAGGGYYIQDPNPSAPLDVAVGIDRDSEGNLMLIDFFGSAKLKDIVSMAHALVNGILQDDGTFVIDSNGDILTLS